MLLDLRVFDAVVVSTDDDEIADISESAGATVFGRRPSHLSDDHAGTAAVIDYELSNIEKHMNISVDSVCTVYPAAVLVRGDAVLRAQRTLSELHLDAVMSALPYPAPIERAWTLGPDGTAEMQNPEFQSTRSQDLKTAYFDAGQFYWSSRAYWSTIATGIPTKKQRVGLSVLKPWEAVDIDTPEDWELAERLYRLAH